MPNTPKTPHRQVRMGEAWDRLGAALPALGAEDRSAFIRQCVDYALRVPGVKQPRRLTEDQARELLGDPES